MKEGLVSIITPVYNSEKYVVETIESVLAQTYSDWEMILVDDGSKDHSAEVIRAYEQKDPRITLLQQPNGGSANARNNGIRHAEGQYIALLDSDDLWDANFLESQIALMKRTGAVVVNASYRRIDENSKEILTPLIVNDFTTIKQQQMFNRVGCLSGLYDTTKFGKIYLKEELKSIRDDFAYWLDIIKLAGGCYGNKQVLASYRVMQSSTTGKKQKLFKSQYKFYRNYEKLSAVRSAYYTFRWMIHGIIYFYKIGEPFRNK